MRSLIVFALAIALVPAFAFAVDGPTVYGHNVESTTAGKVPFSNFAAWYTGLNIPSPGSYGGAGASFWRNDTLWVICINGDSNGSGEALGACRSYNVRTNTWATNAVDPAPRAWTSAVRVGTTVYVLGGLPNGASSWGQMTGTFRAYNITTNAWTQPTAATTPCGSSGMVAYQDSLIYAIGGMGTGGVPINNVQLFNITSGTWRAATAFPTAMANGAVAILRDTIYYICGCGPSTTTFNNTVYRGIISPSNKATITWTLVAGLTYPGASRHRMDADLWGGNSAIGNQIIIGPGAGAIWWGTGSDAYTFNGTAFTATTGNPATTSDAMTGAGSYLQGGYRKWRFVVASGLVMSAPYHILTTSVYGDSLASGVESPEPVTRPGGLSLAVSPNPSRGAASVSFSLPVKGVASLKVYDAQGRLVNTLASGTREAGTYGVSLTGLSAGTYFLNLQVGTYKATKSLVVVR